MLREWMKLDLFRRDTLILLICFVASFIAMIISAACGYWGLAWYPGMASIGFAVWIAFRIGPRLLED